MLIEKIINLTQKCGKYDNIFFGTNMSEVDRMQTRSPISIPDIRLG